MGISGLLSFVNKACRPGNVQEFQGMRVAVDVSCLLHRGVFGCVEDIAHGVKTDFCIRYIQKYLNVFFHYRCKVTLVFDGSALPAKKDVNESRKERRESNQRLGSELITQGKNKEAYAVLRQGIGVPREITEAAIKFFNEMPEVEVIVAPYEADAQLAYLSQNHLVDVVVTQDSDLIVFACEKIIFKLEIDGSCTIFEGAKLHKCFARPICNNFNFQIFRRICILSGCDYLNGGLPGVGFKKAESFFARTSQTDPRKFLPRIPGFLNLRGTKITEKFIESFIRAENTFLHQIVYDPRWKVRLPLTPYPGTNEEDYRTASDKIEAVSRDFWYAGALIAGTEFIPSRESTPPNSLGSSSAPSPIAILSYPSSNSSSAPSSTGSSAPNSLSSSTISISSQSSGVFMISQF